MFKKLTLAAAAGAGYVLGAKAGKERYAQIESKFREIAGMPAVQNATTTVKETASGVADSAKATVNEKVESASSKSGGQGGQGSQGGKGSSDVVADLGTGANTGATPSTTGSSAGSTAPISGASASNTTPDVTRPTPRP